MRLLREKVLDRSCPVVLYELIPPATNVDAQGVAAYAECAAELTLSSSVPIDAINLPEIRSERREAKRTHPFEAKTDQRAFACQFREAFEGKIDVVVNRCTVYEEWPQQQRWLEDTRSDYQIDNVVLVGGESSRIRYPGPSVTEMAQSIRYVYDQAFFCGGITIPDRRHADTNKDEAHRLIHKGQHGLAFFTSQVLYDAASTQSLLRDYDQLCREQQLEPKRVFLSFAPVSSKKDVAFLRWLGVDVPQPVESDLLKTNIGVGWRSLKHAKQILESIIGYVNEHQIQVPLGLNVEHITRHNFELSKEFIEQLGQSYLRLYELSAV